MKREQVTLEIIVKASMSGNVFSAKDADKMRFTNNGGFTRIGDTYEFLKDDLHKWESRKMPNGAEYEAIGCIRNNSYQFVPINFFVKRNSLGFIDESYELDDLNAEIHTLQTGKAAMEFFEGKTLRVVDIVEHKIPAYQNNTIVIDPTTKRPDYVIAKYPIFELVSE